MRPPVALPVALLPLRGEQSLYVREPKTASLTLFGLWLWYRLPHLEIAIFPRLIWSAPGVYSHQHWWPRLQIRLWTGPPHKTADRRQLRMITLWDAY